MDPPSPHLCNMLHISGARAILARSLGAIGRGVLNFVYPARCLGCDVALVDSGLHLCDGCWRKIVEPPAARCGRCSGPVAQACEVCSNCREWETPAFERALVLAPFQGPMQAAIHALKFQYQLDLGRELGHHLARVADYGRFWPQIDVLVPVPLHAARQRERGYNQSELIAAGLGAGIGKPVDGGLLRRRLQTRQQAKLEAEDRRRNLAGAFRAQGEIASLRIGLVDDVLTTGATLDACAAALVTAGCRRVLAIAAASPF